MGKEISRRESEILSKIIDILKKEVNPDKIILFGSRAKDRFCKNSDFDIAIDKEEVDIRKRREITDEIEKALGLYKFDLVFLKSVDNSFRNIILETGKIIYERS